MEVSKPKPVDTQKPDIALDIDAIQSPVTGSKLILQSWAGAENKGHCAPIGSLVPDTGLTPQLVKPSVPSTQVGWAILFMRGPDDIGYSIEGMSRFRLDGNDAHGPNEAARRAAMREEFPGFQDLPNLGPGAYAGYMALGEDLHTANNPDGIGMATKAFVRIPGQTCTYSISDRISRVHLETTLSNLRMIDMTPNANAVKE